MKVKVTPPYEGAGSFEAEAGVIVHDGIIESYVLAGVKIPASWCEPIPEVVPEPGDICLYHEGSDQAYIDIFVDCGEMREPVKVLARKPKGWIEAQTAACKFVEDWHYADAPTAKQAAYERFLSAILGVPYVRVGE